jgi:outer membrane protein OmpA-like peptidoglycan-associated protein
MRANQRGRILRAILVLAAVVAYPAVAAAQGASGRPAELQVYEISEPDGQILSFRHLVTTEVMMHGTSVAAEARIKMKVESHEGYVEIDINRGDIKNLRSARSFGKDYLTYVMWSVSVDGKAQNIGEITFKDGKPKPINVTTPYQTFWLMVTAEPDYAVTDPSPLVVLYSINQDSVTRSPEKKANPIPGKLFYYTHYTQYDRNPGSAERGTPNEILQARKAIELASGAGILSGGGASTEEEGRARSTLDSARQFLSQAEAAFQAKAGASWERNTEAIQFSRTAIQIAENARALALGAVGGIFIRQLENEVARLKTEVENLNQEMERLRAANAPMQEENARLRSEIAEFNRKLTEAQSELAQMQEQVRRFEEALATERARADEAESRTGVSSQQAQELQRQIEELSQQIASLQTEQRESLERIAQLGQERDSICGELNRQLSSLGQLTGQGGSMVLTLASDILYDSGSFQLKPEARENLAKLAVLRLLLFPDAQVRYEGHTDLVGEDGYNQWLSEQRALSVYHYFLEEAQSHEAPGAGANPRLGAVTRLLGMRYGTTRTAAEREELLAGMTDAVLGKGEREPIVGTQASEEKNRRVVLHFPPSQAGQFSSICNAASN